MLSVSELFSRLWRPAALSDVSIEVGAGQFCDGSRVERGKRIHAVQGDQRHCSRALRVNRFRGCVAPVAACIGPCTSWHRTCARRPAGIQSDDGAGKRRDGPTRPPGVDSGQRCSSVSTRCFRSCMSARTSSRAHSQVGSSRCSPWPEASPLRRVCCCSTNHLWGSRRRLQSSSEFRKSTAGARAYNSTRRTTRRRALELADRGYCWRPAISSWKGRARCRSRMTGYGGPISALATGERAPGDRLRLGFDAPSMDDRAPVQ